MSNLEFCQVTRAHTRSIFEFIIFLGLDQLPLRWYHVGGNALTLAFSLINSVVGDPIFERNA